jgi:hypothetical protein
VATNDEVVAAALQARKETRHVEFVAARPPWPELLKDVAAMANSGGGAIVVGRNRDGSDSGGDARVDRNEMIDAFAPLVGERFDDFTVIETSTNGTRVAVIVVAPRTHAPLVFEKAGTYTDDKKREKTAFARGTIYFRHGARSAPGTARDVTRFIAHEVDDQRRGWARNVRKVASAPRDAQVLVVKPKTAALPEVRVVDDPNAPTLARTDFDLTHPYRQTEVIRTVNERSGRKLVSGYDLLNVRKVYDIADRPEFFHRPKFGSPQYSEAFVRWIISEWQKDPDFFAKAKAIAHPPRVGEPDEDLG